MMLDYPLSRPTWFLGTQSARNGRITDVEEGISALLVVEIARDRHAHVRLILVIGALQDDRLAAHLAAGIVDGEMDGDDAPDPARIGKYGTLVVQDANRHQLGGFGRRQPHHAT